MLETLLVVRCKPRRTLRFLTYITPRPKRCLRSTHSGLSGIVGLGTAL